MLSRLLKEILNETVSMSDINDAMDNHKRVIINYHTNGEDNATGARVIEVYAYGLTKAGNPVIRAFEPYGDTTTQVPRWKFFRLDRISLWKPTEQTFNRPASFYHKGLGEFNPNDDLTMSTVYKITKFDNDANMIINKDKGIDADKNIFKTDTELGMERLKQHLDNPISIKDLKNNVKSVNTTPQTNTTTDTPEDDVFKTDTELGMEKLRKQLENPTYLDHYRDKNDSENEYEIELDDEKSPEDDVFKTDTELGMEKLRKQLNNPRYIDLNQFSKR